MTTKPRYYPIGPKSSAPDWQGETWLKRLEHCTLALFLHGFLTPQETETVKARLANWTAIHKNKTPAIPGTRKRKAPHIESVQQAHERISKLTRKGEQ